MVTLLSGALCTPCGSAVNAIHLSLPRPPCYLAMFIGWFDYPPPSRDALTARRDGKGPRPTHSPAAQHELQLLPDLCPTHHSHRCTSACFVFFQSSHPLPPTVCRTCSENGRDPEACRSLSRNMRTADALPLVGGPATSHPPLPLASHNDTAANMAAVGEPLATPPESQDDPSVIALRPSTSWTAQSSSSSNRTLQETNGHASNVPRPGLQRAKSDFGPRLQREESADSADEVASTDGTFKIRHGWQDQLTSEEYNDHLTSVRSFCHVSRAVTVYANVARPDFLHVLHRQEA